MNQQPKVSVIMPSLNVGTYIRECIESVVNQTLKEIEIICVDAGSTDGTLEILQEYVKKDKRIKLILSDKKSYGYQMNLGIDAANGEYIGIVETDDYILPAMYEELFADAKKYDLDICKEDAWRFTGKEHTEKEYGLSVRNLALYNIVTNSKENPDIMKGVSLNQLGIYKLEFLKEYNIRFNETPGASYQDNGFFFMVFALADKVLLRNRAHYMLRRDNPNSSVKNPNKVFCMCDEHDYIRAQLSYYPDVEKRLKGYNALRRLWNYDFTLERVSPEFRLAFVRRFADDFRTVIDLGELDELVFDEKQLKKIHAVIDNPDLYYYQRIYRPHNSKVTTEADYIRSSTSYRIGRAITWLPRKVRGGIRCFKEHGVVYTVRRTIFHIKSIIKKVWKKLLGNSSLTKKQPVKNYEYYSKLPKRKYAKELELWYKKETGNDLKLKNPKTYNEKLQWMKLYDSTPLKTKLADKYLVREWVAEKIGEEYLVPLLGVWNSFDEIDFEKLPDKFVLKANHGCGWNIIVKDKTLFDRDAAKVKFDKWMKTNFAFCYGMELHYMEIAPKIIAEEFLENNNNDLYDYKVFCFNGRAESIMFLSERKQGLKMSFYDLRWNKLPFAYSHPQNEEDIPKPQNLELLITLAEKLAAGFPHVRVDFYILNDGTIKFGEMTFTSASGTCKWNIPEQDFIYGDLIKLPPKSPIPERKEWAR